MTLLRRVTLLSLLPAACALLSAPPADTSLFYLLSPDALAGTAQPTDGFGSEDKLVGCRDQAGIETLVFVDLDNTEAFESLQQPQVFVNRCGTSASTQATQAWRLNASTVLTGSHILLSNPPPALWAYTCLDIARSSQGENATVLAWTCRDIDDPKHNNQLWTVNLTSIQSEDKGGMCMRVGFPGEPATLGSRVTTAVCDESDPAQLLAWDPDSGRIVHTPSGYCLDAGAVGRVLSSGDGGATWTSTRITALPCPDPGNPPLIPRSVLNGYTVGVATVGGVSRLIILDGEEYDNNLFYSDDCGVTWLCYDSDQPWSTSGRSYSTVLQIPHAVVPGAPLIMGGGVQPDPYQLLSDLYYNVNGGVEGWQTAYDLPDQPVWPGQLALEASRLVFFSDNASAVYALDDTSYNTSGFVLLPGATSEGSFGRRLWVSGAVSGGCWVSTDYNAGELWVLPTGVIENTNLFSTAASAEGPWRAPLAAPWEPRAAAAFALSLDGGSLFYGGGIKYEFDTPTAQTFGDVWQISPGVCLLGVDGTLCTLHGTPEIDTVTCDCVLNWAGDELCGSCAPGFTGPTCTCTPSADTWGPLCAPCATPCVNGACDGGGTNSGTGQCDCTAGWTGPACDQPSVDTVTATPSPTPTPTATNDVIVLPSPTPSQPRRVSSTPSLSPTPVAAGGGGGTAVIAAAVSVSVVFAAILALFAYLRVSGSSLGALVARVAGGGSGGKAHYAAVAAPSTSTWRASSAGGAGSDTARAAAERLGATKAPELPKGAERVSLLRGGAKAPTYSSA